MQCQRCSSERVISISAKCSDLFSAQTDTREYDGYVPADLGIGDSYGDYVEFDYCMECGQIQGEWPRPQAALEVTS